MRVSRHELIKLLKMGKNIYVGYCMNSDVDGIPMEFENNKIAISTLANYEAEVYKLTLVRDEIQENLIYDPFDCFN